GLYFLRAERPCWRRSLSPAEPRHRAHLRKIRKAPVRQPQVDAIDRAVNERLRGMKGDEELVRRPLHHLDPTFELALGPHHASSRAVEFLAKRGRIALHVEQDGTRE